MNFVVAWCVVIHATYFLVIVLILLVSSPPSPQIKMALPPRSRYWWIASICRNSREWTEIPEKEDEKLLHQPPFLQTFRADHKKRSCPLYGDFPELFGRWTWTKNNKSICETGRKFCEVCLAARLTLGICECWNGDAWKAFYISSSCGDFPA